MNPVLLDFPHEFTSDRLFIRMPLPGDGPVVHEAIKHSLNELQPWMPFAQELSPLENLEANIRESHAEFLLRKDLRLHIFHKESGEFIGSTGFHRLDWKTKKVEIGYWIDTRHSGKGYIREAVQALTEFAFTHFEANRVEIRCDELNVKSRRVAESVGFELEGILRNESLAVDGVTLRNACIYSKIKI